LAQVSDVSEDKIVSIFWSEERSNQEIMKKHYLPLELKRNQVHYYCDHLLAYRAIFGQ
jgi:hypothetical protein